MSNGLRQGWCDSSMVQKDRTSRLSSRWTPRGLPGCSTVQWGHEGFRYGPGKFKFKGGLQLRKSKLKSHLKVI